VAIENGKQTDNTPVVVSVKDMQNVLKALTSSPVALFIKQCSLYEKIMLAAVLRCVRREGVPEISWLNVGRPMPAGPLFVLSDALKLQVCRDHDNLIKSMFDTPTMLSNAELQLVFSSLLATRTLTYSNEKYKVMNDRKLALGLGMDANEVGRVLMAEGEDWARVLAGL
jgi:origin recognition complex subunit 1